MGWYTPDVYGSPDVFGLTLIGEIEWEEPCYSFDTTIVLKDADGKLYWGSGAGCSCPSPFEDFTSIGCLDTGTAEELQAVLQSRVSEYSAGQVADILLQVNSD